MKSGLMKAAVGIVGTIFLGAIGSGLWEVLFRPIVGWISAAFLSAGSMVFRGYVDILYRSVSRDPAFSALSLPYVLIIVLTVLGPWFILFWTLRSIRELKRDLEEEARPNLVVPLPDRLAKLRHRVLWFGLPFALVSSCLYIEMFVTNEHTRQANLFVERSIEIVAPGLDERERLQLRSEFRAIESAADFYRLEEHLREVAKRQSLKLPAFTSIR